MSVNYGWTSQSDGSEQTSSIAEIGTYWVEGTGSIPAGAVKAGVDKDERRYFVGRASHGGDLLPAKVVEHENCAYVTWDGKEHRKDDYEVLCRGNGTVIWADSSSGKIPPGAFQVGVTEEGERLYVGRVLHYGVQTIGKVQQSHEVCYIGYQGEEIPYSQYEVLVIT